MVASTRTRRRTPSPFGIGDRYAAWKAGVKSRINQMWSTFQKWSTIALWSIVLGYGTARGWWF